MPRTADVVVVAFKSLLVAEEGKAGQPQPKIAKGDCCIALQLIRMKMDDFQCEIDPSNPGRFRGTTPLLQDMRDILGDCPRFHVTKWGASHMRGALRNDDRRGNKRHLIEFVRILNSYSGSRASLEREYRACVEAHHRYWESFSLVVEMQRTDPFQARILRLLLVPSRGRVQQGLVYSALKRRYGESLRITTKKTFAGDDQSSQGGRNQRGDIQVWGGDDLLFAIEVKDTVVDEVAWRRVEATHAVHDYPLFILAKGYSPPTLRDAISSQLRTFALHITDFVVSLVAFTLCETATPGDALLHEIVDIFNRDFCDEIENDPSLRITIRET